MAAPQYHALVVDDEVPVRKLVGVALAKEGFACDFAADGVEALQQVTGKQYDAVVTDLRMPNRHGHALAVDLLNLLQRPVIVIHTGVIEPRLAKDLLARGVDDIVFKPVSFPVLAAKVRALVQRRTERSEMAAVRPGLGEEDLPSKGDGGHNTLVVSRDDLERRLSHVSGVLPISHVALEVYRLATNDECEAAGIAAAIEKDGALAAELLRIGNSAHYNSALKRTSDLQQIVLRIGRRRIGEVALAANALASLTAKALPWLDVGLTWQRSVATRVAMDLLIEEGRYQYLEKGLLLSASMHALGRVVLGSLFPGQYERMLAACQVDGGALREQERQVFAKSHAQVMARVLDAWKVPADVYYPLEHVLDGYQATAALSGPARTRVELLKVAMHVGRLVVGVWMPWDAVEIPPAAVFERLRIESVSGLVKRARAASHDLLQECGRAPSSAAGTATVPRPLGYAGFANPQHDALTPLMAAMGFVPERCAGEDLVGQPTPVLINAAGVDSQFLKDVLQQSAQTHTIVCEAANSKELAPLGRLVELPTSYRRLHGVCEEMSAT